MAQYTRTTAVDSGPAGDSVKQAVLDVDTDLTGIIAAYNAHDAATTPVHGLTGTNTGDETEESIVSKLGNGHYLQSGSSSVSDSSGTIALDFSTSAGFYCTLSGTGRTVTFSNPTEGQVYRLLLIQDATGSRTITTWPTITWLGGGTAPTLSTAAGAADVVTIWRANGVYYGSFAKA